MKNLIATALVLLATVGATQAQSIYFENLYKDYQDSDDAMTLSLTGNLMTMASWFADEGEDQEMLNELGKSIDRVKMVMLEDGQRMSDREIDEFRRLITSKENFEELMIVRDGDETVEVLAIESGGVMSEIIMLIQGDDEFVVMDIWGEIDMKHINEIIDGVDFH
ncbi:MAG TPA: hypothetical protein DCE41_17715 [Cytophagales bacterium]|nr:hypothetical protein [Cytophagales bacterium]HAA23694.1 hypothetical protein [Cytophagales bacterium]HAP62868.1 hypothetical protein [Cytophagales bacterium]